MKALRFALSALLMLLGAGVLLGGYFLRIQRLRLEGDTIICETSNAFGLSKNTFLPLGISGTVAFGCGLALLIRSLRKREPTALPRSPGPAQ